MVQLFVASSGRLHDRWLEAFPDAAVVEDLALIQEDRIGEGRVIWLDTSSVDAEELVKHVQAAVSLGSPVVVMSTTPNEAEAFRLLSAGAKGYCHLGAACAQLREISVVVQHGGLWMLPELMQRFLALSTRVAPAVAPAAPELNALTSRELMVAEQVARGASNREIAVTLNITERTVKAHLSAIFEKLGVRDRVQLALAMNNIPTYTTVN